MNKKTFAIILLLVFMIGIIGFGELIDLEASAVDVYVDGELLDTYDEVQGIQIPAFLYKGRTMLPLRKTFELFGIYGKQISWEESTSSVTVLTNEGDTLWLQIDNPVMLLNGEEIETDVPAKLFNSRTFVPMAFISSVLGEKPLWHSEEGYVTMTPSLFKIETFNMTYELSRKDGYNIPYYESLLDQYVITKKDLEDDGYDGSFKMSIREDEITDLMVNFAQKYNVTTENFGIVEANRTVYYWEEEENVFHLFMEFDGKTFQIKTEGINMDVVESWIDSIKEIK